VTDPQTIFVETPARLHFGVLDLRGQSGRWFGGIGAAAPEPTLVVSATAADVIEAGGDDAARAAEFARRFLDHYNSKRGVRLHVHRALPPHAGLGSGTQLALAVARAVAGLLDLSLDAPALARAVGRARRSAVGTWTFAHGGLVVEGGRPRDSDGCGPLVAHHPFPASWRCIVAIPEGHSGLAGTTEEEAFAKLPRPPQRDVEHVAHLVLMALLPALTEGDLPAFGAALSEIQEINGRWFAKVQGSTFAPGRSEALVRRMTEWGASGVGQSSWGPTVYGIVSGEEAARQLADRVRTLLDGAGTVYEGPFRTEGARVWRSAGA
jgi:beta-ribofuranosylaminobenzene 5'-phosphate synthase